MIENNLKKLKLEEIAAKEKAADILIFYAKVLGEVIND